MTNNDLQNSEYQEAGENMRTYINLRFAQLTIFIALNAGLFNALQDEKSYIIIIAGLLSVPIFYSMEHRAADHFQHFKNYAIAKQEQGDLPLYVKRVEGDGSFWSRCTSATGAVRFFFLIIFLTWAAILYCTISP